MVSEVLSYLIMITCILIWVSSKEVKWTVRDTSPKLGQGLTLFCKVDNCTVHETKRWHGGPDKKPLMSNSGISTDKTKYSTSIEKNGFILNILNLTVKDLNISYTCSCGLDLDKHILYIEDVYTVDNLNITINDTNYIGTNDVGGISLYVYIAIAVAILVILLIIVIVVYKRHWLLRKLREKNYGTRRRNTDIEEETPMNVVEGNLKFQPTSQELLKLYTSKDEGLKTEGKQNEEQITNLQTEHEELLRPNTLKDEELKTEGKQNEEQITNLQTEHKELFRLYTLKDEKLKTERNKNEEQKKNLQAKHEELLKLYTLKDEKLKTERKKNEQKKNLQTKHEELLKSYTLKDEELKTERKQNEEQRRNLQTINKDLLTLYNLKDEELKTEGKQNEEQITNLQTEHKELLRIQGKALRDLRTEMKQNKEKYSATIARFETQIKKLKAEYDEDCKKLKKAVGEQEREKERVKEGSSLPYPHIEINQRQGSGSSLPYPHIEINQKQGSGSSLPSTHIEINRRQGSGEINSLRGNAH